MLFSLVVSINFRYLVYINIWYYRDSKELKRVALAHFASLFISLYVP